MRVSFQGLTVDLLSADPAIREEWTWLFDPEWAVSPAGGGAAADVRFQAALANQLPSEPARPPLLDDPKLAVRVYRSGEHDYQIFLSDQHFAALQFNHHGLGGAIESVSLAGAVSHGRFEDLTTLALAPFLRRRGIYLVHAFAASDPRTGQALLLAGESGSGKTTTGLALLSAGWRFLANDVAGLCARDGIVQAVLAPGSVHVTGPTLEQFPELDSFLVRPAIEYGTHKIPIPRRAFLSSEVRQGEAPVTAVCFPRVINRAHTTIAPVPRAVGLARLLSASMDRWDSPTWDGHLELLSALAEQAQFADLLLGRDARSVIASLAAELQGTAAKQV